MYPVGRPGAVSENAESWRNGINQIIGRLSGQLEALVKTQEALREDIAALREDIGDIKEKVGLVRGKIAVWGMIGGAFVSLLAQLALYFLRR